MSDALPGIDVVILTWNDGDLLDAAVASARASEGVHVRVIVVDNGSDPAAEPDLGPGDLLIREPENLGVAAGRNVGVAAGDADLVCLLDSDARLHPRSLAVLAAELTERVGLVAPVFDGQLPAASAGDAPTLATKLARVLGRTDQYRLRGHDGPSWEVDFAIGACQLFRRSAYEAVGGLDERYFYGPEDADFCMRLRVAGWKVLQVRDAGCVHPPRRRNRKVLTVRGLRHAWAVAKFLWYHRDYRRKVAAA